MSHGDEFQIMLPSNVTGLATNTPGAYETTLAFPLDLPGTWEVALMDIKYPHTFLQLDKECVVAISTVYTSRDDPDNVDVIGEANSMDLVKALRNVEGYWETLRDIVEQAESAESVYNRGADRPRSRYRNRRTFVDFKVKKTFTVVPGKYKLKEILDKIQTEIRSIGAGLEQTTVTYDKENDRVVINGQTKKLLISSYNKNSILPLLGFGNDIRTNRDDLSSATTDLKLREYYNSPGFTLVDYILIDKNKAFESDLPPKIARLNEIYVYTDIIDTVLVGNTQVPLLGYFPIQTKWGDNGYWNFNPVYYIKVKENTIRTISIRLCDETGDTIKFESGNVICRLHFRRVGLMRGIL